MDGLQERLQRAVQQFWLDRGAQSQKSATSVRPNIGTRGSATGGGHMTAFELLLVDLLTEVGIERLHTRIALRDTKPKVPLELPGYFRVSKQWDVLVIVDNQLLAAIELKSQVGSTGNNLNNRVEEAIGNATDLWTAFREGRLGPRRPFLGFFFLLEDTPKIHNPVRTLEPYFSNDPIFRGAPYADRYRIFCQRLVLERLYDATCLTLATNASPPEITHLAPELNFQQFVAQLQGHAQAFVRSR